MTILRSHLSLAFFMALCFWLPTAHSDPVERVRWRTLTHVQQAVGATHYAWDGDSLCFSNSQRSIRFYQGRRKLAISGTTVWLNAQPTGSVPSGDWQLAAVDLDLLQLAVLAEKESEPKRLHVLIDPGHGGEDDGAASRDPALKEKNLTLSLAQEIAKHLEKAGMRVDLTRTHDTTLSLAERARLANKKKADLFLCVHANHASNAEATGIETYVLPACGYPGTADGSRARGWQIGNRNDYHNTLLGFSIHSKLVAQTNTVDRGLKRQSFFVLRETSCPAVLLELGFLSNRAETLKMVTPAWQKQCADAVTAGVIAYAKRVEALDRAVAEKRSRDTEANERWRLHLAASQATPQTSAMPPPTPPLPTLATSLTFSASSPVAVFHGTNAAPVEINSLIDFYTTDTVN